MTASRRFAACLVPLPIICTAACDDVSPAPSKGASPSERPPPASAPQVSARTAGPPQLLYLPDGGDLGPPATAPGPVPGLIAGSGRRCPREMVSINGKFCIDRHEARLVDAVSGRPLSPYYHPTLSQTKRAYTRHQRRRLDGGTARGAQMPVPPPPEWQLKQHFEPRATSELGVRPSGYLNRNIAEKACKKAGKRLCREQEWETACRGQRDKTFPYGDGEQYESGRCNVFREAHPAQVLYGNASIGHLDPRLNRVSVRGKPLLRKTGVTGCKSVWGLDAVHDMVGNLDEWVDDEEGVFRGGFYARSTKAGCGARISSHGPTYFDYSLGMRCCLTP